HVPLAPALLRERAPGRWNAAALCGRSAVVGGRWILPGQQPATYVLLFVIQRIVQGVHPDVAPEAVEAESGGGRPRAHGFEDLAGDIQRYPTGQRLGLGNPGGRRATRGRGGRGPVQRLLRPFRRPRGKGAGGSEAGPQLT